MIVLPPIGLSRGKSKGPKFVSQSSSVLASGTSMPITKPAGVQSGDVLIHFHFANDGGQTVTPPGSWITRITTVQVFEGATHRIHMDTLVAGGSEPANYTWSFAGGGGGAKGGVILAYRPVFAFEQASSSLLTLGFDAHTMPSINTAFAFDTIVYAWLFNRAGTASLGTIASPPSGMAQRYFQDWSAVSAADHGIAVYDQTIQTAGPTGTRTLTTTNVDIDCFGVQAVIRP